MNLIHISGDQWLVSSVSPFTTTCELLSPKTCYGFSFSLMARRIATALTRRPRLRFSATGPIVLATKRDQFLPRLFPGRIPRLYWNSGQPNEHDCWITNCCRNSIRCPLHNMRDIIRENWKEWSRGKKREKKRKITKGWLTTTNDSPVSWNWANFRPRWKKECRGLCFWYLIARTILQFPRTDLILNLDDRKNIGEYMFSIENRTILRFPILDLDKTSKMLEISYKVLWPRTRYKLVRIYYKRDHSQYLTSIAKFSASIGSPVLFQ